MENKLVKINNVELGIKEFKNERVITAWDIADVHEKQVYHVNEVFKNNIDRFQENRDHFIMFTKDFLASFKTIQKIPNNVKEIFLFTERGYLKLTKAFNDDLSWKIQDLLVDNYFKLKELKPSIDKDKRLEIMEKNANVRMSKQYLKLAETTNDIRYKEALIALSTNVMSDKEILPLPKLEQKSYNAEEIGKILGISSNMVGRIANKCDLKNDRYGYLAQDKAKHCNKPVESFRYYEHAIDKFKEILNEGKIA